MSLLHLSRRGCVYLHIISLSACDYVSCYKQCLPLSCNIIVLYVICLNAHGPSWPNASIKNLSIYVYVIYVQCKV